MVIEILSNWDQVFEQMRRMQAAGLIDGFMLEDAAAPQSSKPSFYSFSSRQELDVMAEVLPGVLPKYRNFAIEKGATEVIGGKFYKVLKIRASV